MDLLTRSFEVSDQESVPQLILTGLVEHFDWIDASCNPDLDDIVANYIDQGDSFVVTEVEDKLVGAGALITEDKNRPYCSYVSQKGNSTKRG
ncbi:MAG: hypothetical protein JEZ06_14035 [Anaerolineaceae bacterium]|nr:hypothetical protein [Anaerolineaceae bacterium]